MHITMVNNYLYLRGGSERVLFEEAELLQRRRMTVSFYARRHAQNRPAAGEEYFPPLVDPDTLTLAGKCGHAPRIIYNARTYRLFAQFLRHTGPHLVHAHNIYGGLTSAVCDAARRQEIPVVMTLHDYKLLCPAYLMLRHGQVCNACLRGGYLRCVAHRCHKGNAIYSLIYALEAYLTRWGDKYGAIRQFICPSDFMRQQMLAAGYAPARVTYLPNAVDVDRYEPRFVEGDYVLYVGRLSQEKGIVTLLTALRELPIPLVIVGDGPLRDTLASFIDRHAMTDRVRLHGYQTGDALRCLYQQAAFVVMPSEWYENAPMTVLEAFAYGKAVIGTRLGGLPEMITPDATGCLVPPGDAEALRDAIRLLWEHRPRAMAWGRAAREVAATRFAPHSHLERLLSVYQHALGG